MATQCGAGSAEEPMRSTFVQVRNVCPGDTPWEACSTTASCTGAPSGTASENGSDFGIDHIPSCPMTPEQFNSDNEILGCLLERSLAPLEPITQNLCVVLAQPELSTPRLRSMGFIAVKTLAHFTQQIFTTKECPPKAEALLLPSIGNDTSAVQQLVSLLNQNPNAPTIIVVLLAPPVRTSTSPQTSAEVSVDFGRTFHANRAELLQAGADDVVGLCVGEVLRPHRIMEILQRSEFIAMKISEIVQSEVRASEERAARKLQVAYRKFLMHLPGRVLENIPFEEPGLKEEFAENRLVAVGEYRTTKLLGSGAFGQVYHVEHATFGTRAIKVVPKSTMKNVNAMFSLDREICLMLHAEAHTNVAQALEVLHGPTSIHIVMEYAGLLHLHAYTKRTLQQTGASTLDAAHIQRFSRCQAVAVQHLHVNNICHRDLKPNNWIVSDSGDNLKLADFGLAAQMAGPGQLVKQSCGSLPFVAPEVFKMGADKSAAEPGAAPAQIAPRRPAGYDGTAADMWSFGVGLLELTLGPYAVERMLGWRQNYPSEKEVLLAGLREVPNAWQNAGHVKDGTLRNIISNVLVLDPAARWKIARVVGTEGLGYQQEIRPPKVGRSGTFSRSAASLHRGGIEARVVESQSASESVAQADRSVSLCHRMGGHDSVKEVVNRMMDLYLGHPGFGECLESSPSGLKRWRDFLASAIPRLLDEAPGSQRESAVHTEIAVHHAQIDFLGGHLQIMLDNFKRAMSQCHVDGALVLEALERFKALGSSMTSGCRKRMADALVRATKIWKAGVIAATCTQQLRDYAKHLESCIQKHEGLRETVLVKYNHSSILERMQRDLQEGSRNGPLAPLASPLLGAGDAEKLGPVFHLCFCNLARDSLHAAGLNWEIVSTLHLVNLQQWDAHHFQASEAA